METMRSSGRHTRMYSEHRVPGSIIAGRILWFLLGVVETVLAFRFLFRLLGANTGAGFVQFIYSLTDPLVAPFTGIFGTPAAGAAVFEPATLLAMLVYAVVAYGVVRLLEMLTRPRTDVVQHVEEDHADVVPPTDDVRLGTPRDTNHRDYGSPHPIA